MMALEGVDCAVEGLKKAIWRRMNCGGGYCLVLCICHDIKAVDGLRDGAWCYCGGRAVRMVGSFVSFCSRKLPSMHLFDFAHFHQPIFDLLLHLNGLRAFNTGPCRH